MHLPGQAHVRRLDGGGVLLHERPQDGAPHHLHLEVPLGDERLLHLRQHHPPVLAQVLHALALHDDGHDLHQALPHVPGEGDAGDDVLQEVGPEAAHVLLGDGGPLADEAVLDEAGGLEQDVVHAGRL